MDSYNALLVTMVFLGVMSACSKSGKVCDEVPKPGVVSVVGKLVNKDETPAAKRDVYLLGLAFGDTPKIMRRVLLDQSNNSKVLGFANPGATTDADGCFRITVPPETIESDATKYHVTEYVVGAASGDGMSQLAGGDGKAIRVELTSNSASRVLNLGKVALP